MTHTEKQHNGIIYPITDRNSVMKLNGLFPVRFAAFAAGEQGLDLGNPVEVYVVYGESTHPTIIQSAQRANDNLFPIACGFIDLSLPRSATVFFMPAERVLTLGTTYVRRGLQRVNTHDADVIKPTVDSIQKALTIRGKFRSRVPQIYAEVEQYN